MGLRLCRYCFFLDMAYRLRIAAQLILEDGPSCLIGTRLHAAAEYEAMAVAEKACRCQPL